LVKEHQVVLRETHSALTGEAPAKLTEKKKAKTKKRAARGRNRKKMVCLTKLMTPNVQKKIGTRTSSVWQFKRNIGRP